MSGDTLDFDDPAAVLRWLTDLRVAWLDANSVTADMLAPLRRGGSATPSAGASTTKRPSRSTSSSTTPCARSPATTTAESTATRRVAAGAAPSTECRFRSALPRHRCLILEGALHDRAGRTEHLLKNELTNHHPRAQFDLICPVVCDF